MKTLDTYEFSIIKKRKLAKESKKPLMLFQRVQAPKLKVQA